MANRTWTATDLQKGRMTIEQKGSLIAFGFRYRFQDANGDVIPEFPARTIVDEVQVSTIPANIVSALVDIQDYLYNKALQHEGMS